MLLAAIFFLHLIDLFTLYALLYARETVVISMKEFFRILSYDLHWKKQNLQANVACCRANSVFIFSTVSVPLRQGRIREFGSKWNLLKATRSIFFFTFMSGAKLAYNSWVGRRKGGPAWITLNLWGRRSPNFWTSQSCSLSSNWFFECENPLIDKPMVIKEPAVASAWLLGWDRNYILATCRACSAKILLDSCRVEYANIEQVNRVVY